ncbi:MAG: LPXTG cell wall anchor domain-containing protein [Byssovorax sp.]
MASAYRRAAWAALFLLLTSSAAAHADELSASSSPLAAPAPSASSAPPRAPANGDTDSVCDEAIVAWTERASRRTGLTISPASCPFGLVRLQVTGAGCDFEVSRDHGFQRTEGGAFGVSPIVDMDWTTAPEPMKKAFTSILSALAEDPSLPMGSNKRPSSLLLGSRRNQIAAAAGLVLLVAAAFVLWWRRRRRAPAAP